MKLTHLSVVALILAGCSAQVEAPSARAQAAGGSPGALPVPESGSGGEAEEAGASGAPSEAQGGAAGDTAQPSEGGSAGDQGPRTPEQAGAGGESGAPAQLPTQGPAPGKLWGYCNVDPQSPEPQLPCVSASHSCWPVMNSEYRVASHGTCAPGCDSVHTVPGSAKVVFGLDPALKAQCEAVGGTCGRLGPDWQDACYRAWPPVE